MKAETLEALKSEILTLQLPPGAPLDERALAERFGLSRTPMREVLRRLAGDGFVVIHDNRGAQVAPLDVEALRQFFQCAPMIYTALGQLAAERADRPAIDAIKRVQRNFRRALRAGDAEGLVLHNDAFHRAIGAVAANPYLQPSYERLLIDHSRISKTFYRDNSPQSRTDLDLAAEQHDAMIDALAARDPAAIAVQVEAHWQLSRRHMLSYVHPEPLSGALEAAS